MQAKINVSIPEIDLRGGALQVLKDLRPNWKSEDVRFMDMTEGITNKLIACYHASDKNKNSALVMRVYGEKTDLIIDRDMEKLNLQLLQAANFASEFYASFNNGICYAFVPGRSLNIEDVSDPHISKLIAEKLAKMHAVDPSKYESCQLDTQPCIWKKTEHYLDISPESFDDKEKNDRYQKTIPSKDKLWEEYRRLKEALAPFATAAEYCHNDLLVKNIIYNKENDEVSFIDYEYGAFNFAAYDIGNHFNEFAGVETVDYNLYPAKEFQIKWLRYYLKAKHEFQGKPSEIMKENDIEKLYVQANKFSLLSNFFWGVWALIQSKYSLIDFDYLDYANIRLSEYFAKKDQHLALQYPQ